MTILRISILLLSAVVATITVQGAQRQSRDKFSVTIAYIVRHAEKMDESSNADLSLQGFERAKMLQWMLRDVSFDKIYSTQTLRTKNTVLPIAMSRGMKITSYSPRPGMLAKTIKQKSSDKSILISGHSNTIPQLLGELGVAIDEDILKGYDDIFIVIIVRNAHDKIMSTSLQRLHYPGNR